MLSINSQYRDKGREGQRGFVTIAVVKKFYIKHLLNLFHKLEKQELRFRKADTYSRYKYQDLNSGLPDSKIWPLQYQYKSGLMSLKALKEHQCACC